MHLFIQIPCFNEEQTLGKTLSGLPRSLPGVSRISWLLIDDGSTDASVRIAREAQVDHIITHKTNIGLAKAFRSGLQRCTELGADIIVNMDADNQYQPADLPRLLEPILTQRADMVIGQRPIDTINHFSFSKKLLQRLGSTVVSQISGVVVPDVTSGFRAFSRRAADQIMIYSDFTYTIETILQARSKNIVIESVAINVNEDERPSRLFSSSFVYVLKTIATILRTFSIYNPFRFFFAIGTGIFAVGLVVSMRFLYFYLKGDGEGHVQSVVLAGVLLIIGFQTILVAFLADLLSVNRRLIEDIRNQWSSAQENVQSSPARPNTTIPEPLPSTVPSSERLRSAVSNASSSALSPQGGTASR